CTGNHQELQSCPDCVLAPQPLSCPSCDFPRCKRGHSLAVRDRKGFRILPGEKLNPLLLTDPGSEV
ncbi:hypothetical protein NDU88_002742, partial [Pleurodeles waltl]